MLASLRKKSWLAACLVRESVKQVVVKAQFLNKKKSVAACSALLPAFCLGDHFFATATTTQQELRPRACLVVPRRLLLVVGAREQVY